MAEFLEACQRLMRYRYLSYHTERSYLDLVEKFVRHFKRLKLQERESWHVREYLTYLMHEHGISAATQNVAFSGILFLFRHVLDKELDAQGVMRAKESKCLIEVLTKEACPALLAQLPGTQHLLVSLLYGAGLRLSEGLRLRVKDVAVCLGVSVCRH